MITSCHTIVDRRDQAALKGICLLSRLASLSILLLISELYNCLIRVEHYPVCCNN